jgi:hypothetical protein
VNAHDTLTGLLIFSSPFQNPNNNNKNLFSFQIKISTIQNPNQIEFNSRTIPSQIHKTKIRNFYGAAPA